MTLLGLPGLYQNWLMSTLDVNGSFVRPKDTANFNYKGSVIWKYKMQTDCPNYNDDIIINLYVTPKNFPWYLYNFFEKTDDVGIRINQLPYQIFTKAPNTVAFDGFLKHFCNTYNVKEDTNKDYVKNALIEYFYFMFTEQHDFKEKCAYTEERFINIEYDDFSDEERLISKLHRIPKFDLVYFKKMYALLLETNSEYLNRKRMFLQSLNNQDFDIIETAYIGSKISPDLDWFNEDVRKTNLQNINNIEFDIVN